MHQFISPFFSMSVISVTDSSKRTLIPAMNYRTNKSCISEGNISPRSRSMHGELRCLTCCHGNCLQLYQLREKDTQTKLETLFKKNLYVVAIRSVPSCPKASFVQLTLILSLFKVIEAGDMFAIFQVCLSHP